ncbi:hypothetical protein ACUNV4_14150 [Granulosicoccus sp. 3-233]|uniref:hypothetical protein n=1 Tax=Granulosicoccus sp. 3-233 TaxID=3417969 RepID=UPI003D34821B
MTSSIPILLISGPVGVGKTAVGNEVSEVLERDGVPHTFIDFDQLRYTFPRPDDDPRGNRLGLQNLAAIWENGSRAGALNLVVSYVIEERSFIDSLLQLIPAGQVTTVQLSASMETLCTRLMQREIGSGLDWHLKRAVALSAILAAESAPANLRMATDGLQVIDIAQELVSRCQWRLP